MKFKVVVTDYEYASLEPEREVLEKVGAELILAQCRTCLLYTSPSPRD